jgi:N,N'-diacetyllegionaminate synthase
MLKHKTFIIAEIGVNHDGDINKAKLLIDKAKEANVDAVKFQTFNAKSLVSPKAHKAEYQKKTTQVSESQFEMIKRLELSHDDHIELIEYCKLKEVMFLSSPFDIESIKLLDKLNIQIFKIPSGEITNLPFLEAIGQLNKEIILSTGMSDMTEIEQALQILQKAGTPLEKITVLHVNTEYPTPMKDVNLTAMLTIKDAFQVAVGYSDHTLGIEIPIAAVALGASVIEKHFTMDKNACGPDHRASLDPKELKSMVQAIRNIEIAMGDGVKIPSVSELKNKPIARKSIIAIKDISKGEVFTSENLGIKRPGTGLSPMLWNEIIGRLSQKDIKKDELLTL